MSAIQRIQQFITYHGLPNDHYRIGTSNTPEQRLFGTHGVRRLPDDEEREYLINEPERGERARNVKRHFINRGVDGGVTGPDGMPQKPVPALMKVGLGKLRCAAGTEETAEA